VLQSLAGSGVIRGVALNPGTPLEVLEPLLDELELVFLLAINPGWGGQKFLPSTERRLAAARAMIGDREILLEVDGGVTKANIDHVATLGADLVVSGSAIYDGVAPLDNARFMLDAVRKHSAKVVS
jgi:ribulose-phosphate 3-epimerase